MKKEIKILYFGTPDISAEVLSKLIDNGYNICAVVAQQDKPVGRGKKILPVPTKSIALKHNIPVYQFDTLKDKFYEIDKLEPDLILTMAYGKIMPLDILNIPVFGSLNLHGSILPKYRGAAPIQRVLMNGDTETGVSLMKMVKEMDAGEVYGIEKFPILEEDNYDSLCHKIAAASFKVFDENIENYLNGSLKGVEQDKNYVTFAGKILEEDEIIDFNNTAIDIVNKIRGLSSKPGAYFLFNNEKYKVFKASIKSYQNDALPGTILKYDKNGFVVSTKDGSVSIENLQKPGKKAMNFKDFFNGNQNLFKINEII